MTSNNYETSSIPTVSPAPAARSSQLLLPVSSPTCVGRSLDFAPHYDSKENIEAAATKNKKNKATVVPTSPPAKKSKIETTNKENDAATKDTADMKVDATAPTAPTPKFKIDKYSVGELKDILDTNGQHVTGRKDELIARILDGEKYGRLDHCPDCEVGRLKVRPHHQDIVFCPGSYDAYYGGVISCGYVEAAEDAPRRGDWLSPPLRRIEIPEVSPADQIKAEYKKMSKKELSDLLISKGQGGRGTKKLLLERIIDAKLRGLLGNCSDCGQALFFSIPDQVICSSKKCPFHCTAGAAPRNGKWQ